MQVCVSMCVLACISATISCWIYDYFHCRLVICLFIRYKLVSKHNSSDFFVCALRYDVTLLPLFTLLLPPALACHDKFVYKEALNAIKWKWQIIVPLSWCCKYHRLHTLWIYCRYWGRKQKWNWNCEVPLSECHSYMLHAFIHSLTHAFIHLYRQKWQTALCCLRSSPLSVRATFTFNDKRGANRTF